MKRETLLIVVLTLVVGVLIGILVSKGGKAPAPAPQSGAPQAPVVNYQQQIRVLEEMVAKDPANRSAWVQLGHLYFDSDNPMKAIEAYNRALELDPNDADVLTDQGVMFRRLGWFDKAIENFSTASRINPAHLQSLYNLGVVYRYDLQDYQKARDAWTRYLERNPAGPGADQIQRELQNFPPPSPSGK